MKARQLTGAAEISEAQAAGQPLALVLARRETSDPASLRVIERARADGVLVREASDNDLRRMSKTRPAPDVLALVGRRPQASIDEVAAGTGCAWLLVDVAYAGNAGYAIRTAEVSGADGIFLDADLDDAGRQQALRTSMHAERFLPVHWAPADAVLSVARAARRRIVAIEDVGDRAPWDVDLCRPTLFMIGGEGRGIPEPLLTGCDDVLRLPMAGFIPAYNLQAAMAAVALERLRQLEAAR